MEEKKIVYSIVRYTKNNDYRMRGIGKLVGNDLILNNDKLLEDVVKNCHPIPYKKNEFKGYYDEYKLVDVETKYGNYDVIEVYIEYSVWYKII